MALLILTINGSELTPRLLVYVSPLVLVCCEVQNGSATPTSFFEDSEVGWFKNAINQSQSNSHHHQVVTLLKCLNRNCKGKAKQDYGFFYTNVASKTEAAMTPNDFIWLIESCSRDRAWPLEEMLF